MNTTPNFKIDLVSLLDRTLAEVETIVKTNYKCPLKDLKFLDLLTIDQTKSEDKALRHGVYLFFRLGGEVLVCRQKSIFRPTYRSAFWLCRRITVNKFLNGSSEKTAHARRMRCENLGKYMCTR